MTNPTTGARPVPRIAIVVALVVMLAMAWLLMGRYTSAGARQCQDLYNRARSAADTAKVDSTITPASLKETDPRSCGFMRSSARWQ